MIPYKVLPMIELGPVHVNMYGIMFSLGIVVASLLAIREAKKRNISKDIIWDMVFYLFVGIIIGARLFYVFFYWPQGVPFSFIDIFTIWKGGLAFFGGLIGALVSGYCFVRKRRLRFWTMADIFTIPLVIGHIFGRVGDYFTGAHPGKVTSLPWSIYLNDAFRHPVVLYEIIGLIIIVIILLQLKKFHSFDGFLFSSYIILYSSQRMFLDIYRIESTDPRFFGFTPTQYTVVVMFLLAMFFMIIRRKKLRKI